MKIVILFLFVAVVSIWLADGAFAQGHAIQFSGDPAQQVQAEDSPSLDITAKNSLWRHGYIPLGSGHIS